jgi:hypothetical protein
MLQDTMEVSTNQIYPIGMRLAKGDRVYRYCQADADRQLRAAYGVWGDVRYAESGALAVQAPAGSTTLTLTAVGTVALNEFQGGVVAVNFAGIWGEMYGIRANTAAAPGGTFTITLDQPTTALITVAGSVLTCFQSPWRRVVSQRQRQIDGIATDYRKTPWVGVPNRFVPAGKWCWVQTWGPCAIVGSSGTEGVADSERAMQMDDVGAMLRLRDLGDGLGRHQIAGFVLPVTTAGAMPYSLFFLQIAP